MAGEMNGIHMDEQSHLNYQGKDLTPCFPHGLLN